jgi:hypothetical protein
MSDIDTPDHVLIADAASNSHDAHTMLEEVEDDTLGIVLFSRAFRLMAAVMEDWASTRERETDETA